MGEALFTCVLAFTVLSVATVDDFLTHCFGSAVPGGLHREVYPGPDVFQVARRVLGHVHARPHRQPDLHDGVGFAYFRED